MKAGPMTMAFTERSLKSSKNFIWSTSARLGKGATGHVFQGMNKETGEPVAVKTFNQASHSRPLEVQRREYEVLSKVNHENIVRLIAIEEELPSPMEFKQSSSVVGLHKVIIMELCTGGSLFNILDDPASNFGLEENEFLLVLKHLAAGMKHLRDMNIVHRDLKPGNIMKFITEDGRTIYKLTDFGAARELQEDQQFKSLYGTEEYLHPELYEKAVLRRPAIEKLFSAKVDLWSIGVTLYHLATGSLPFRPYGGRKNKEVMHRITTEKQHGMISGIQQSEDGVIEYHSKLPRTCLLSQSLQDMIVPLLAGLLEYNPQHMLTFDRFFQQATHILNHRAVHVFFVNNVCDYIFYMEPSQRVSHLKAKLAVNETAHVPIGNQLLIWNKRELLDDEPIVLAQIENPICLLNSKATSIKATNLVSPNQFKFPEMLGLGSLSNSCEQAAQQGKACSSIAYCIQRNARKCSNYCTIINQIPQQVLSLIESNERLLNEKRESCLHLLESLRDQIEYTSATTVNLSKCLNRIDPKLSLLVNADIDSVRVDFHEQIEKTWKELTPKILDLRRRVEGLKDRWGPEADSYTSRISAACNRAEFLCSRIKESWLFAHKLSMEIKNPKTNTSRPLTANESQLLNLEKKRIDVNCQRLLQLLADDNYQAIQNLVEKLDDWYNDAHVALVQSSCLFDELSRLMKGRERVLDKLNGSVESQHLQWQRLIGHVSQLDLASSPAKNDKYLKTEFEGMNLADDFPMDCAHDQEHLKEEMQNLKDTYRLLCNSLSENQNLFSELVSITISTNNHMD